jgi:prevent-host-death family protein
MRRWQLQDAKARLSEVVRSAQSGPQEITLRGEAAVVVLAKGDYDRLRGRKDSFVAFLRRSPLAGVRIDVERDRSRVRKVRL